MPVTLFMIDSVKSTFFSVMAISILTQTNVSSRFIIIMNKQKKNNIFPLVFCVYCYRLVLEIHVIPSNYFLKNFSSINEQLNND